MISNTPLWDRIAGNWKQMKGSIRERWGELTDDEIEQAQGKLEHFVGTIQERYGLTREEARRQVDEWTEEMKARI